VANDSSLGRLASLAELQSFFKLPVKVQVLCFSSLSQYESHLFIIAQKHSRLHLGIGIFQVKFHLAFEYLNRFLIRLVHLGLFSFINHLNGLFINYKDIRKKLVLLSSGSIWAPAGVTTAD
jgi:hypothetical protein